MKPSEKSLKNLKKCRFNDPQVATAARLKGLKTRRTRSSILKLIDDNYDRIVALLSMTSDAELKKALDEWTDMPLLLKIYLRDLTDPGKAKYTLETIVDRVKGKPKICVDQDIKIPGKFEVVCTTRNQADELNKAMED